MFMLFLGAMFVLMLMTLIGCDEHKDAKIRNQSYYIYIEEIDGCEYIVGRASKGGLSIVHKQNCKNH